MSTTILLDADYVWYRAASASEDELDFSHDITVVIGSFSKGKSIVNREIDNLLTRFDTDKVILFFTAPDNFRKDIDPEYKGNRTKRKPCGYRKLVDWGKSTWPSQMYPRLEADDVLGIVATNGSIDDFVLVSPDKDMLQIPCRHYDFKTEFTQSSEAAEYKLWEQTLTGDATDGYKGLIGCGPKRASQILKKAKGRYWEVVVEAYKEAGQTEADALRNLQLARILQVQDYDTKTQTPILITP